MVPEVLSTHLMRYTFYLPLEKLSTSSPTVKIHLYFSVTAMLQPLSIQHTEILFDHFSQKCESEKKRGKSQTKVSKPWQRACIRRCIWVDYYSGILAVGLYPDLAIDYDKYIKGLEMILEFDCTNRTKPDDVSKMELWMGDLFAKRYKPMEVSKKAPRDTPRSTRLVLQMVLLHKYMDGPRSWFLVVILAFMVKFQKEQGKRIPSFKCMTSFAITN